MWTLTCWGIGAGGGQFKKTRHYLGELDRQGWSLVGVEQGEGVRLQVDHKKWLLISKLSTEGMRRTGGSECLVMGHMQADSEWLGLGLGPQEVREATH